MRRYRWEIAAGAILVGLTSLSYAGTVGHDFVNYDDPDYVVDNPYVRGGLTGQGFVWAWTTTHAANWHPLTWLSLQLDAQLGGTAPSAFHRTNLLLHLANTVLLFVALRSMSGACWPSALVAGLFGLHPLHVESVAWVAERKDVLSTLFGFAALIAYASYARRPSTVRYLLVALGLALSLLSKPMLVTLPCVFLLLDYWPLRRWQPGGERGKEQGEGHQEEQGRRGKGEEGKKSERIRCDPKSEIRIPKSKIPHPSRLTTAPSRLIAEKLPLFALSAASCVMTVHAQARTGAIEALATLPMSGRVANALAAYLMYLGKTLWPVDLAVLYPLARNQVASWQVVAAGALLAGVTAVAVRQRRNRPYLVVGWLWYIGTLVPVIGLVQVGHQALADRYTYFPLVGVFIAVVWAAAEVARQRRIGAAAWATAAVALAVLLILTRLQADVWQNSVTLWRHTLEVTKDNATAHLNLGQALETTDLAGAIDEYREVIRLRPDDPAGLVNLGAALQKQGDLPAALEQFRVAVESFPGDVKARLNLAQALEKQGAVGDAGSQFAEAVERSPREAKTHFEFGAFLARHGNLDEALLHYQEALRLDPADAVSCTNLGVTLARLGRPEEGLTYLRRAVELDPQSAGHWHNLGFAYLELGQADEATRSFRSAVDLEPHSPRHRRGLDAALARHKNQR
ncbi:MAG TPA: tetratricopeptide repeat protein [Pirellulales bacterium]|nr:tetratricopeptide repeat protein [Pirellulales bacterium]